MIPAFRRPQERLLLLRSFMAMLAFSVGFVIIGDNFPNRRLRAQNGGDPTAQFQRAAASLSAARLGGGDESQAQMEKALDYLDSLAIPALNLAMNPDLDGANRRLAQLVSHQSPVGEYYRLLRLGGTPAVYALVANFGLGGPAAIRIYGGMSGHYALAAQIDHFVQKDFLDSDVELVPVSSADIVFVTISGRTDDLSTGAFTAWQFNGRGVVALWNSDLLQQSSYEVEGSAFRIAYCSQVDDDRPSQCLKMSRDLYGFNDGQWKRVETAELRSLDPAAK